MPSGDLSILSVSAFSFHLGLPSPLRTQGTPGQGGQASGRSTAVIFFNPMTKPDRNSSWGWGGGISLDSQLRGSWCVMSGKGTAERLQLWKCERDGRSCPGWLEPRTRCYLQKSVPSDLQPLASSCHSLPRPLIHRPAFRGRQRWALFLGSRLTLGPVTFLQHLPRKRVGSWGDRGTESAVGRGG